MISPYIYAAGVAALIASYAGVGFYYYSKGVNQANIEIAGYVGQVATLELSLAKAQNNVDVQTQTEFVDRTNTITEIRYINRDVVRTVVPEQYTLSQGWVYAHNQAARAISINPLEAAMEIPSETTDIEALDIIVQNYAICETNAARVDAWISWATRTGESVENTNTNSPN